MKPTKTPPLISPLIPPDDFARQLTLDELTSAANSSAAAGRVVICSAFPEGLEQARAEKGDARASTLLQELTLFIRRNLRGFDAVTVAGDEIILLLQVDGATAGAVADRLRAAVRGHVFSSRSAEQSHRFTLSVGMASAPEHGVSFPALLAGARQARSEAGADGSATAFAPRVTKLDLNRFVGRTEALTQLTGYLDDGARGVGRVVAIVGERGVGTSTLVRTLTPEIRIRGGSLVGGSCREHRFTAPYALWSEVLRALRRLPVKSTRQWHELPSLDPTLERPSAGESRGGSKTTLLEELADFFRLAAQQRPLVLLLENLQWADSASWDAMEYLITQLENERILMVLTFQHSGEDDALERWSHLVTRPRHSEIQLAHLTRDDVKRWLEAATGTDEIGRDILSYVYRHTEGNPLVLVQLMRDLEEGGHLVPSDEGWRWSPAAELPTRVTIDELLARRIARLGPTARAVLEAASAIGREAEETLLLDSAVVTSGAKEGLQQLLESGMLVNTFDRSRTAYVVAHDKLARVVNARRTAVRDAELHGRIAQALAAQERHSAAEIAAHFEAANNRVDAHRYALLGADHAEVLHETAAVARLLEVAERNAPTEAERAEVRVRMAALAEADGRYDQVEELCAQALKWYEAQHDSVPALRLKCMRVRVRLRRGQTAGDTLETLFLLEAEAREARADAERGAILLLISEMHWRFGDLRAAQRVAAECVEIAERGTDALLIADACNRFALTIQLEDATRARELYDRSLDIATVAGEAVRRVRALNNIGVLEQIRSNWDEARQMLTLAVELARTARLLGPWGRAELNLGVLAGRLGDYEGATRSLSEALRLTSMAQNSDEQMIATYNLAHNERERLHYREAADTYALVTELAERIGQAEVLAGALAGLGLCQALLGDLVAARASYERAAPMLDRLVEWFQGRELIEALRIRLLLSEDRMSEAAEVFRLALNLAGPSDMYGAAWLTSEFGGVFRTFLPDQVRELVQEYSRRPEVLGNPKMRERLGVLKVDS